MKKFLGLVFVLVGVSAWAADDFDVMEKYVSAEGDTCWMYLFDTKAQAMAFYAQELRYYRALGATVQGPDRKDDANRYIDLLEWTLTDMNWAVSDARMNRMVDGDSWYVVVYLITSMPVGTLLLLRQGKTKSNVDGSVLLWATR